MTIDQNTLESFFLGLTLINFALLLFSFGIWILAKNWLSKIYAPILNLTESKFSELYISALATYKILTIIFALTPYLVVRFWL